jgi:hypothetical protein
VRASGGNRIAWADIPADVRHQVEAAVGARVEYARNQAGGFSPGLAARCRLSDGRRLFVKAASPEQNPFACRVHRREAEVASQLPSWLPAPRLRHVVDDGHWVALVFDEVDGHPPSEPWTLDQLDVVVPAIVDLGRRVTPSPLPHLQSVVERHRPVFDGWRRLAGGDGPVERLDGWAAGRLDDLAALEAGWEEAAIGDTLLHADLRADNLLLTADGTVVLVDWPWACVGAAFVDPLFMLPSVGLGGGPAPAAVVARYGLFVDVDRDAVLAVLAACTGFFVRSSLDPPPPGLPSLRAFQAAQGELALEWLRSMSD